MALILLRDRVRAGTHHLEGAADVGSLLGSGAQAWPGLLGKFSPSGLMPTL